MKPIVATTYAIWPKGQHHIVRSHIKADAIQRQFKKIARIYCGFFGCRVYTKARHGTILYDTARGDWVPPEVGRVKRSRNPVLLIGRLKTPEGIRALDKRLRETK
jgi:hypothetical protein